MNQLQSIILDLLRILAVQMVLIGHALPYFNIRRADYIQNSGVVLFFVLSGLVISYSLFNKMKIENYGFRDFFIDRFSRIYTGLVPALIFIFLIDLAQINILGNEKYLYHSAFDVKTFIGNLLMMQDFPPLPNIIESYTKVTSFASGRPLWTLAVEWWLYMSFGMLIINYYRSFNVKYFILLSFFMIVPIYNAYTGRGEALTLFWIEGVIVTIIVLKNKNNFSKPLAYLFFIIGSFMIYERLKLTKEAYDLIYVTFISMTIASSLVIASFYTKSYNKVKKSTHFIAAYSFTLYLIHYSIYDFIRVINGENKSLFVFFFAIILSNALSVFIAYYTKMRYKRVRLWINNKLFNIEKRRLFAE